MPRYYVEQHWDGDFTAGDFRTVVAQDDTEAANLAAIALAKDRGDIEAMVGEDCSYDTLEDYVGDMTYTDSVTELPDSVPSDTDPIKHLLDSVSELLNNRQHLDLHEDDRRMLDDAHQAARRQQQSRDMHG